MLSHLTFARVGGWVYNLTSNCCLTWQLGYGCHHSKYGIEKSRKKEKIQDLKIPHDLPFYSSGNISHLEKWSQGN